MLINPTQYGTYTQQSNYLYSVNENKICSHGMCVYMCLHVYTCGYVHVYVCDGKGGKEKMQFYVNILCKLLIFAHTL